MEHITYIGEVVEKLADHSSFPELFIKYEEGDPIPSGMENIKSLDPLL